jgi:hypothetical protein
MSFVCDCVHPGSGPIACIAAGFANSSAVASELAKSRARCLLFHDLTQFDIQGGSLEPTPA